MAEALKKVFTDKNAKGLPAFVTFLTAGYPLKSSTVPLMLALEKGGADVIELGVPFSDPMADGPAIQASNTISLDNGTDFRICLDQIAEARAQGLTAPVVLMGYYNPIMCYGEERAVKDAREAGANGFIVVDLPPEEAVRFREICTKEGLSYVPLIAPSTTDARIKFLSSIADSFIYVVSKMGVTGSTANGVVATSLPSQIKRIRQFTSSPLAVGFGVATKDQFDTVAQSGASGVVIGSRIINVIGAASSATDSERASALEAYCKEVTSGAGIHPHIAEQEPSDEKLDKLATETAEAEIKAIPVAIAKGEEGELLPSRFGEFGGQYVAEALVDSLVELEQAHRSALADPAFWKEYEGLFGYMNRPSQLYEATRLTEHAGGAKIWLKREDLNHTGSHKINNALGQILLARRLGKTCIIAETGAGQHGVATATACAKFGMKCKIYMGAEDVRRQALNVFRIKMLGAEVVPVTSGSQTLKDAINEAMRDWVVDLPTTHYCVGSAIGPHPFPTIVRDFQRVIGKEIKSQLFALKGKLPDAVVACVGGGSNAIGTFYDFIPEKSVRLIGVEAGGDGVDTNRHSATLSLGVPGVLHGVKTYLLQSKDGQIIETHSISPGLDYPGVGPEHSWLKDTGRAEYLVADDEQALRAFRTLTQLEGIIPALESAHAIHGAIELAKTLPKDQDIVVCLSGRGDKDVEEVFKILPAWAERLDWRI